MIPANGGGAADHPGDQPAGVQNVDLPPRQRVTGLERALLRPIFDSERLSRPERAQPGKPEPVSLALLRSAGVHALVQHTKLPRAALRRLLLGLLLGGVSDRALQRAWDSAVSTRSARITP